MTHTLETYNSRKDTGWRSDLIRNIFQVYIPTLNDQRGFAWRSTEMRLVNTFCKLLHPNCCLLRHYYEWSIWLLGSAMDKFTCKTHLYMTLEHICLRSCAINALMFGCCPSIIGPTWIVSASCMVVFCSCDVEPMESLQARWTHVRISQTAFIRWTWEELEVAAFNWQMMTMLRRRMKDRSASISVLKNRSVLKFYVDGIGCTHPRFGNAVSTVAMMRYSSSICICPANLPLTKLWFSVRVAGHMGSLTQSMTKLWAGEQGVSSQRCGRLTLWSWSFVGLVLFSEQTLRMDVAVRAWYLRLTSIPFMELHPCSSTTRCGSRLCSVKLWNFISVSMRHVVGGVQIFTLNVGCLYVRSTPKSIDLMNKVNHRLLHEKVHTTHGLLVNNFWSIWLCMLIGRQKPLFGWNATLPLLYFGCNGDCWKC